MEGRLYTIELNPTQLDHSTPNRIYRYLYERIHLQERRHLEEFGRKVHAISH